MKPLKSILISIFSLALVLPGQNQNQEEPLQKRLEYEVSIRAQIVPIFAVDNQGNPVYDLKKEEIEFYADGKPSEIIYLNCYQVEQQREKPSIQTPRKSLNTPARLNFIILDTLISNKNLLGHSLVVAMGIIKNASPGDAFIILESNQVRGFQYIIGPEKDEKKLADALKRIEKLYIKRRLFVSAGLLKELASATGTDREIVQNLVDGDIRKVRGEKGQYQRDIRILARSLQQLKYALKTITVPKIVFLISAGPKKNAQGYIPIAYYRLLEDAAKAINFGGSMFYVINPLMQRSRQKRTSLKFMTDKGGGKCIHGRNIRDIVDKVKKGTSAYYELAFYSRGKPGSKSRIRLKCKRKGVELTTIGYSELGKPYHQMNFTEKKLFALNVVNGGSWSRMVAKVGKITYKKLKSEAASNPTGVIEIPIPSAMRKRQLDLFLVSIDPETQKAAIVFKKEMMEEKAKIEITPLENRNHYFIIIEPQEPFCIYNQVI